MRSSARRCWSSRAIAPTSTAKSGQVSTELGSGSFRKQRHLRPRHACEVTTALDMPTRANSGRWAHSTVGWSPRLNAHDLMKGCPNSSTTSVIIDGGSTVTSWACSSRQRWGHRRHHVRGSGSNTLDSPLPQPLVTTWTVDVQTHWVRQRIVLRVGARPWMSRPSEIGGPGQLGR